MRRVYGGSAFEGIEKGTAMTEQTEQNAAILTSPFGVPERVLARDVPMTAAAFPQTRTVFVSGAVDASAAVTATLVLPAGGTWRIVETKTNLSGIVWGMWTMSIDKEGSFADDVECPCVSAQFSASAVSSDRCRLGFREGRVFPGESFLAQYAVRISGRQLRISHGRPRSAISLPTESDFFDEIENGYALDPAHDVYISVETRL